MGVDNSNLNSTTGITLKPTFGADGAAATQGTGGAAFKSALQSAPAQSGAGLQTFSGAQTITTATGYGRASSAQTGGPAFGAGASTLPGSLAGGAAVGGIGGAGGSVAVGGGGNNMIQAASGGDSQSQLFAATKQMQETQMSFNLQYLQLQSSMQNENRQFTMVSNIMKTKHDTVKNSILNVR